MGGPFVCQSSRVPAPSARHPLWRSAVTRLPRTPGWFAIVGIGMTLFVASVVAPSLFVTTAKASALADGLRASAGAAYGPDSADLRVTWNAVLPDDGERYVLDRLDALEAYGAPSLGAAGTAGSRTRRPVVAAGDRQEPSELWYHDGAVEALGGDPDADGVWLAADVARRLGVSVGDQVRVGLVQTFFFGRPKLRKTTLAGTYETAPDSTIPAALAGQRNASRWFLPVDPDHPGASTPLAIVGRATFDRLAIKTAEEPLYFADVDLDAGVTPEAALRSVKAVQVIGTEAFDYSSDLGAALGRAEPEPAKLDLASGLDTIAFGARDTADAAQRQVRPYALGGEVMAAALLLAAWVLLGRSRRREQVLASGLGLRPVEVSLLALLEVLLAAVVAVPAGLGLAAAGLLAVGPGAAHVEVMRADVIRAVLAAAGGLLVVATAAGLAAAATDRRARFSQLGRSRRALPWTAGLLSATAVVGIAVYSVDVADRWQTPLTMALPLLVTASVAVVLLRLAERLRPRLPTRARPGTARWLAGRRTGLITREVTALATVVAITLGLFGYALTVRRGVEDGVADKTAALVGARTAIEVADDFRGHGTAGVVTPPLDRSTIVWTRGAGVPPTFGERPLLAIDPDSFDTVADWGASGDVEAGRRLLPLLETRQRGLPVIIVGDTDLQPGDQGTLDFNEEVQVPFAVVGVVGAFPGTAIDGAGGISVVASARKLFRLVPRVIDPRRRDSTSADLGAFTSWLWSEDTVGGLRSELRAADVAADGDLRTAERQRVASGLIASTWAAAYVVALGVVVLALALGAAVVLALRLADRDAVSDVLLARMGWSPGDLARTRGWEVAAAVVTATAAAVLATGVLVIAPTTIDAVSLVPPLSRPRLAPADVVLVIALVVVMVTVAWLLGAWRARRRVPEEVLRDAT
jgi:hypothetical protein